MRDVLDVGESDTVAMIDIRVPTSGAQPIKQFLHAEMLKLLTNDARSQALETGKIAVRNGHTDAELKDELTKSSNMENNLSDAPSPI